MPIKCVSILCAILAVLACSGCRTVRAAKTSSVSWIPPKTIEKKLSTNKIWEFLRERKVENDRKLDIGDLIDIALSNNPATRQAWEEARVMEAKAIQSASAWYPTLQGTMEANYQRSVANGHVVTVNQTAYGPAATVSWLVFDFGGRSAGVEKARQLLIEANFQFNQAIQDVLLDTVVAYQNYYTDLSLVTAGEADVVDSSKSFEVARERFKAGLVSELDELQAESSYKKSLYALEDAKSTLNASKAALALVLGFPADADMEIAAPSNDIPPDISEEAVSIFIEQALKERPDIAAGRAALEAKRSEVARVTSDLLPSLIAGGSAGANWYTYYGKLKDTSTSYKDDYLYGGQLKVEWDIFDGFKNFYRRKEAQRDFEAEEQKLIAAHLGVSRDAWDSYYNFVSAGKKYEYSRTFLDTADMSYKLASEGYKTGLKNIIDLLSSQSQLSDARSKFIQSRGDLYSASAQLLHAIGALTVEEKADKNI